MNRRLRSRRTRLDHRGQALVEFALIAPLFFLLLFSIIEGARFILYYEMVNNAAREGARYAIVHGSNSSCPTGPMPALLVNPCDEGPDPNGDRVKAAVRDSAIRLATTGDLFTRDPVWWTGSEPPKHCDTGNYPGLADNRRGNRVTVCVDYAYDPIFPVLPTIGISMESTLVVNN